MNTPEAKFPPLFTFLVNGGVRVGAALNRRMEAP